MVFTVAIVEVARVVDVGDGTVSSAANPRQDERLKALYSFTVFGFALTWISGWWMMKHLGYSMGASWISNAMLFGLVSMVGSFLRAFSDDKSKSCTMD